MTSRVKIAFNILLATSLLILAHILSVLFHLEKTVFVAWIGVALAARNYIMSKDPDSNYSEKRTFIGLIVMILVLIFITVITIVESVRIYH